MGGDAEMCRVRIDQTEARTGVSGAGDSWADTHVHLLDGTASGTRAVCIMYTPMRAHSPPSRSGDALARSGCSLPSRAPRSDRSRRARPRPRAQTLSRADAGGQLDAAWPPTAGAAPPSAVGRRRRARAAIDTCGREYVHVCEIALGTCMARGDAWSCCRPARSGGAAKARGCACDRGARVAVAGLLLPGWQR